jgi:hypothetical protein
LLREQTAALGCDSHTILSGDAAMPRKKDNLSMKAEKALSEIAMKKI